MDTTAEPPFPVWQGFRHSWTYNHRLNRLGDWLATTDRAGDRLVVEVAHAAASGTGRDQATFQGFRTIARAAGISYRELWRSIEITATEAASRAFVREIRLAPDEVPDDCDRFAAILSGFDLCSATDADKLASFHLATSQPRRDATTGEVVFQIVGALNVDCDSAECDAHDSTGGMIAAVLAGAAAGSNLGLPGLVAGAVFGALFTKLDITTDYTLQVRCALIAGRAETLCVTGHSAQRLYGWDTRRVITRRNEGTIRDFQMTGDDAPHWCLCIPAITQLSLEVTRNRGILRPDTAMHLLEWDMAVRPVSSDGRRCTADLELFFRNWQAQPSSFLDAQIDVFEPIEPLDDLSQAIASHRDAGWASVFIGLSLLQFAAADAVGPDGWSASLVWDGQGASAKSESAVRRARQGPYDIPSPTACEPPPFDRTVLRIAADLGN
ncbi:hypothetical protein LHP98_00580 [Rhodobacter sp. Har01]|uniref:hypothetical protein n=1 Tax=Rhodobacter sp. Har01 TaxID=2883999 RepID=UPI001D06AABA|nr:hypothetical protein [Rhodobacter sp. Har01]MCB6176625.1 hypothetical protein [Rhodobacter sp. Har01]